MAFNAMNVSKKDFQDAITKVEEKMNALMDVIDRYNQARSNLDQFVGEGDSNYEATLQRIDENVKSAKKAHAALTETKNTLQATVDSMEEMGKDISSILEDATEIAKGAIQAAIKIDSIL